MTLDLFEEAWESRTRREELSRGAVVLRAFALADQDDILTMLREVIAEAPLRHMITPGGFRMSVALTIRSR